MIFLTSPYDYGGPDAVKLRQYRTACRAAAQLCRLGYTVYSPVMMVDPIKSVGGPHSPVYWDQHGQQFLERSDKVVVLCDAGWRRDQTVQADIELAGVMGLQVEYMEPALCQPTSGPPWRGREPIHWADASARPCLPNKFTQREREAHRWLHDCQIDGWTVDLKTKRVTTWRGTSHPDLVQFAEVHGWTGA